MSSLIRGMVTFLSRLRSGAIELTNSRYERRVDEINRRHKDFRPLPDDDAAGSKPRRSGSVCRPERPRRRRRSKRSPS